jgi:hypothetical protein
MRTFVNDFFDVVRGTIDTAVRPHFPNFADALTDATDISENAWNSGNHHTQRILWFVMGLGIVTPLILFFVGWNGSWREVTVAVFVLLMGWFVAVPLLVLAMWQDPLLIPVIATTQRGRAALAKFVAILGGAVGALFTLGILSAVVPIENDPVLVLLAVLMGVAATGFWFAGLKGWARLVGFGVIVLIIVLCIGGFTSVEKKLSVLGDAIVGKPPAAQAPPAPREFIVYSDTGTTYCNPLPAGTQVAAIIVDTRNGFSPWITPPAGRDRILDVRASGDVQIQLAFANGRIGSPGVISPMKRMGPPEGASITGVRVSAPKREMVNILFGEAGKTPSSQGRVFALRNPPGY